MAYSNVKYTGNAATQQFAVPFPYLEQSHVSALVNGVDTPFTWLSSGLVYFNTPPASGASVIISRNSSRGVRMVDFQDAQVLTANDLDVANLQALYIAQEAFDAADIDTVEGAVQAYSLASANSAAASASSAIGAAAAQTGALTSATNSATQAAASAASASSASSSATSASSSATSAASSATAAAASATLAASYTGTGYTAPYTGAVTRTWTSKMSDFISVMDFGAVGDGTTDDTAAVQAAIDSARSIYFPPGTYSVSALTLASADSMRLFGAGWGDHDSIIKARDATSDVITINSGLVEIANLKFKAGVTRTSGSYINVQQSGIQITQCYFDAASIGIINNGTSNRYTDCWFSNIKPSVGIGIRVDSGNDLNITRCSFNYNGTTKYDTAIHVKSTGDVAISQCQLLWAIVGLRLDPTTGSGIFSITSDETFYDHCTYGVYCAPTNNGHVVRCRWTGCWFGSCSTVGVNIDKSTGTGIVAGFQFTGCQILDSGVDGIYFSAGDGEFIGSQFAQNASVALNLGPFASGVTVSGCSMGANAGMSVNNYGIYVQSGAVDYCITGNRIRGNTTAQINDGGGSVNKLIANNLLT
jgi:hypothetical protein